MTTEPTVPRADGPALRPPEPGDAESLVAAGTDPIIAAQLPGLPRDRDEALRRIAEPGVRFVVSDVVGAPRVVGGLELTGTRPGTAEVTFWVLPAARGRGVATAAVRALAAWALPARAVRLELATDVANIAAQRVALGAGFTREGIRRNGRVRPDGTRADEVVWSRLEHDPSAPGPRPLPDLPGGRLRDSLVILRPVGPGDAADISGLLRLPDVARRQVPPGPAPPERIAHRCAHAPVDWLNGARAWCVITDAETGRFAGEISLTRDALSGEAWIGYSTLPAQRGKGYTKAAVELLARWALGLGVPRLCAGTMPDNAASQRVLLAAGFALEGVRRAELPGAGGTRVDDHVYVRLAGNAPAPGIGDGRHHR